MQESRFSLRFHGRCGFACRANGILQRQRRFGRLLMMFAAAFGWIVFLTAVMPWPQLTRKEVHSELGELYKPFILIIGINWILLRFPRFDSANRRLRKHLWRERPYLFTFLYCPGLEATNNAAERALRPLVVARKNWGGNRTEKGARAQAVLTSILQTAQQQGKNPLDLLIELLGNKQAKILDLVPPIQEAPRDCSPAPPPRRVAHGLLSPSKAEFAFPL